MPYRVDGGLHKLAADAADEWTDLKEWEMSWERDESG
jgi:hypothetical protein